MTPVQTPFIVIFSKKYNPFLIQITGECLKEVYVLRTLVATFLGRQFSIETLKLFSC